MSREVKLACGVLLLVISGLLLFMTEGIPSDRLNVLLLISAAFGVPGFLLLAMGIIPPRAKGTKMIFQPARLLIGIGAALSGIAAVYLFYEVIHIAPKIVLIAALLAVPGGLLYAATCWRVDNQQPSENE